MKKTKLKTFKHQKTKKIYNEMAKKKILNSVKKAKDLANNVRNRIALAIGAAFGLVIALAWNDAIREGIDQLMKNLGITGTAYIYKIITAIIITIIAVIGIMIVSKWAEKKQK